MLPVKFQKDMNNDDRLKFYNFSFHKYFKLMSQNNLLQNYTHFKEFRIFWSNRLTSKDNNLKKILKSDPNYNPLFEKPVGSKGRYETYCFEFKSNHGEMYYFTFDVNEMDNYLTKHQVPVERLNTELIYLDPETPYIPEKINDKKHPYFGRMFGITLPFLTIDGSHRIKSQVVNGHNDFTGYIFDENILHKFFVFDIDKDMYLLLHEIEIIGRMVSQNIHPDNVKDFITTNRKRYLQ